MSRYNFNDMLFEDGVPRLSFLSFSAVLEAKTPCYEVTEEEFERHSNVSIVFNCSNMYQALEGQQAYFSLLDLS